MARQSRADGLRERHPRRRQGNSGAAPAQQCSLGLVQLLDCAGPHHPSVPSNSHIVTRDSPMLPVQVGPPQAATPPPPASVALGTNWLACRHCSKGLPVLVLLRLLFHAAGQLGAMLLIVLLIPARTQWPETMRAIGIGWHECMCCYDCRRRSRSRMLHHSLEARPASLRMMDGWVAAPLHRNHGQGSQPTARSQLAPLRPSVHAPPPAAGHGSTSSRRWHQSNE